MQLGLMLSIQALVIDKEKWLHFVNWLGLCSMQLETVLGHFCISENNLITTFHETLV